MRCSSNDVWHHGIKGQSWGVRNGPPYPLGSGDHSAAERKAGWRSSLKSSRKQENSSKQSTNTNEDSKHERKQLTDQQKKWIKIGAAAAVTALAVGGTVYLAKSGKLDATIALGKSAVSNIAGSAKAINVNAGKTRAAINRAMTYSINSKYRFTPEGSYNCTHCSLSYILNSLFGKSVTAKPAINGNIVDEVSGMVLKGRDPSIYKTMFNNIIDHDFRINGLNDKATGVELWDAFKQVSKKSTGILNVPGHVLNYEKDWLGRITLVDTQSNDLYNLTKSTSKMFLLNGWQAVRIMDFSNATIKDGAEAIINNLVDGFI